MVKADRLIARRASTGGILDDWPVYRCLVYQVELDDRLFVLSAGDWFRVDLDYRKQVEADVDALPRFEGLPDADPDTDEDTYNKKAAKHLDAACLDKRFVYDGGPDKMEVYDVLTREGGFIHVKPRGASSTLSHLFSQWLNSAERRARGLRPRRADPGSPRAGRAWRGSLARAGPQRPARQLLVHPSPLANFVWVGEASDPYCSYVTTPRGGQDIVVGYHDEGRRQRGLRGLTTLRPSDPTAIILVMPLQTRIAPASQPGRSDTQPFETTHYTQPRSCQRVRTERPLHPGAPDAPDAAP
jgi:hypothetical protein